MNIAHIKDTTFWLIQCIVEYEMYRGKRIPKKEEEGLRIIENYLKMYGLVCTPLVEKILKK